MSDNCFLVLFCLANILKSLSCIRHLIVLVAIYCLYKLLCFPIIFQAFWDYVDGKQLGTTRAECSVTSEWSPDGRYFMTATTAPRLQIDNG